MKFMKIAKEMIDDIRFYYMSNDLPFRVICKRVKVMYSQGVHFENAKQILAERKMLRDKEREDAKENRRIKCWQKMLWRQNMTVIAPEVALELNKAFPDSPCKRVERCGMFDLNPQQVKDAQETYRLIIDMFEKGWSYRSESDDPTFYYYDKSENFCWANHPSNVGFDFKKEHSKRSYSRVNYEEIMGSFRNRRFVCSYDGLLEYKRGMGLVGGGKDGPDDMWDSSFSRGIPSPKPGYNYNEGFVFCTLEISASQPTVISIPVNCIDSLGPDKTDGCVWDFKIHNRDSFDDNQRSFECARLCSVKSQVNFFCSSDSQVLVKENTYKLDHFNNKPDKLKLMLEHPRVTQCKPGHTVFSLHTDAWKYVGCKEVYDSSYDKSIINGLDNHLYFNVVVDPGRRDCKVVVYFIFKIQFYRRYVSDLRDLSEYYDKIDKEGLCPACDESESEVDRPISQNETETDEDERDTYEVD